MGSMSVLLGFLADGSGSAGALATGILNSLVSLSGGHPA
jgi:hypothetical protein